MSADNLREEVLAKASKSSKADKLFDTVVGHIEDIMIDDKFQTLQQNFLEQHYSAFDDAEENKLIYTEIHQQYVQLVERFLEAELVQRMPSFNMTEFQKQLISRRKHLDGEVFEFLLTITDFLAFKELVLDFKAEKEGGGFDFGDGFVISRVSQSGTTSDKLQFPLPKQSADTNIHLPTSSSGVVHETEPMRMSFDKVSTAEDDPEGPEAMTSSLDFERNADTTDNPESMRTSVEFSAVGGKQTSSVQEQLNGQLNFLVIGNSFNGSHQAAKKS